MSRLYPCVYCTEDGYCKKYSDKEVTSWCVQSPCKDEKPSKADLIRGYTDEELAEWMALNTDCYYCRAKDDGRCASLAATPCRDVWLDWLKQEVDDDNHDH